MRSSWWKWMPVSALVVIPVRAQGQCMGGGPAGGGHVHGGQDQQEKADRGDKKARKAVRQVLAGERSRALLMEELLGDREFMRLLIERVAAAPELRALAVERLQAGGPSPGAQPDSLAGAGARSAPGPKEALYACPMHPEVTASKPGRCPKCGMSLVQA